jgi:hypothetical protein
MHSLSWFAQGEGLFNDLHVDRRRTLMGSIASAI